MTTVFTTFARAAAIVLPLATLALPGIARADALDDAVAWLTALGVKAGNAPHTRESAAKLYQVDLSYNVDMSKFKPADLRHLDSLPQARSFAMRNKGFDDAVAVEVAKLKRVTSVSAGDASMTDKGLIALSKMENLESLAIAGSLFNGSAYTAEALKALATLPKLRDLDLAFMRAGDAGLAALKAAPRIATLSLIGAKDIGKPGLAALAEMKSLSTLVLQWVEVNEEVEALVASKSLRDITFMGSATGKVVLDDVGAAHLAKMKELTKVVVWHTKITDKTVAALATLPNLRTLILNKTAVGDAGFKAFAGHPALATIWAGETGLTDASGPTFASMPKLSSLSAEKTKFTDAGLLAMAANANLTSISLRDTGVTAEGIEKAKGVNPKLRATR